VGITAGSREVPGRNACDRRHTYCVIIIINKLRETEENVKYFKETHYHHCYFACA